MSFLERVVSYTESFLQRVVNCTVKKMERLRLTLQYFRRRHTALWLKFWGPLRPPERNVAKSTEC